MIWLVRARTRSSTPKGTTWEATIFLSIDAESKGQAKRIATQLLSEMLNWTFEIELIEEEV